MCAPSLTFTVLTIHQDRIDDLPADCHPRTRQGRIVFILCQAPAFIHLSADKTAKTAVTQLKKRLQKTRKFVAPCKRWVPMSSVFPRISQSNRSPQALRAGQHEDSVKDVTVKRVAEPAPASSREETTDIPEAHKAVQRGSDASWKMCFGYRRRVTPP